MINQAILCCPPGQMSTLKRRNNRTSILRSNELVEIQGSYWPRILILSESAERRKKSFRKHSHSKATSASAPIKVSRRLKKKEMIRQLKKLSPVLSSTTSSVVSPVVVQQRPLSHSFESSISTIDQNSSSWKPCLQQESKIKTSSFTGRPVLSQQQDDSNKSIGQASSGLKGPRRRKSLKPAVAPR